MQRRESSPSASVLFARLFLLALFSLMGWSALAQIAGITLSGKITAQSGQEIGRSLSVRLETQDGTFVDQRMSDVDGRFEFHGLSSGVYRLKTEAAGFQPVAKEVDLTGPRSEVYVNFSLPPLEKVKQAPSELPALTDEAAPKKARKEYEKGKRALEENDASDAAIHFQKAVDEYPCYARAQTDFALALVMQKKVPEAEAALKKSVTCDGGYLEAYSRLAILLNTAGRFAESEKNLEEGLRLAPDAWTLYYQLAAAHSGLGQYDKAEADYMKVRALNPAPPSELHVQLADLYHRMKKYDKAYAEMQAYLREDPNGRYAARTKAVMRGMESSGAIHTSQAQPPEPQP